MALSASAEAKCFGSFDRGLDKYFAKIITQVEKTSTTLTWFRSLPEELRTLMLQENQPMPEPEIAQMCYLEELMNILETKLDLIHDKNEQDKPNKLARIESIA